MTLFAWLAVSSYLLAFLIISVFAVVYLTRTQLMPYHCEAIARPWSELEPRLQVLLLALLKVIGWAWLALACAGLLLLYLVFFQNPGLALLIGFQGFCLLAAIPAVAISCYLRRKTGAATPTLSSCLVLLLTVMGFAFALLNQQA